MDCFLLSFDIYGFHATVSAHPQAALQTCSYGPSHSVSNPLAPHLSLAAPVALGLRPAIPSVKQTSISEPAACAAASWGQKLGSVRKQEVILEPLQDGAAKKRFKTSPIETNNKALWRMSLSEGSAVEVRWSKEWWNAHVLQVCLSCC